MQALGRCLLARTERESGFRPARTTADLTGERKQASASNCGEKGRVQRHNEPILCATVISAPSNQQQQQQEKGARQLWPTVAARAGCAACFVVVLRLQRGCVGACEGVRGSSVQEPAVQCYSRDTGNEGARDSCIIVCTQASSHEKTSTRRWGNGVPSPPACPERLQCNIQAYAASQPSGGGRGAGA